MGEQGQKEGQEVGSFLRCLPGLRYLDQADPKAVGSRIEQGRKVPHPGHPQRQLGAEGPGSEVYHQVPDEEGLVSECRRWQCRHVRGGIGPEYSLGHEFLGFSVEEALGERQEPPHQVHYGTCPETVLNFSWFMEINIAFIPVRLFDYYVLVEWKIILITEFSCKIGDMMGLDDF